MLNKRQIEIINQRSPQDLINTRHELVLEKMKLDKFFSVWLDENPLSEEDTNTEEWQTYKAKMNEYEELNSLISLTTYYIEHNHGPIRTTNI